MDVVRKATAPSGDGAEPTSRSRGNDHDHEYRTTGGSVKSTQECRETVFLLSLARLTRDALCFTRSALSAPREAGGNVVSLSPTSTMNLVRRSRHSPRLLPNGLTTRTVEPPCTQMVVRSLGRTELARLHKVARGTLFLTPSAALQGPCRSSRPLRSCRDGNGRAIMTSHAAEEAEVT